MRQSWNGYLAAVMGALLSVSTPAWAQPLRVMGADISYWNCGTSSTGISQANWTTAYSSGGVVFVFLRATRGGTTGLSQTSGTPGNPTQETLSRRYDDPRFVQNLIRAIAAGMVVGPYHFGRPDNAGNVATDEADHFIQMAGPWMRPGYLMPMYDMEAGSGSDTLAQFAIDFSDRLYAVMKIRPCIYINGNYSSILQGATQARRDALAKPSTYTPSMVGPAYPMLWDARYSDNTTNPTAIPVQTGSPKYTYTTSSGYYGPWDDYGNAEPWSFWQYASVISIPGFNAVDATCDSDVSHGDLEYVRNFLVPAVWWNDSSGDWSTLANWNCGQTPTAPVTPPDQATPYATGGLPSARLPGAAGTGPTSGQYDTVILERPSADITVTVSSGTHNVRKLYMRETLNLTGGSLTVNYAPTYRANDSALVLHGGPLSAQFSGPVTLNGGSLNVHTLQVDASRTFTLTAGSLAFSKLTLMPGATPARLAVSGDVNFGAYPSATAVVTNGTGTGISGQVDLTGGTRAFTVASGVDLFIKVPVLNGGLTKSGLGTLHLDAVNSFTSGTTVSAGTLEAGVASALSSAVTNTAGTLKLDHAAAMPSSATLVLAGAPANGAVNLNFTGTQTVNALYFGTTRKAAGTWAAAGAAHTSAAFSGAGQLNVLSGPASTTIVSRTAGSSPAVYGEALTFTATVTGNVPGGTVQFRLNGVAVGGPVPLVGGCASLVTNSLPVSANAYQITAAYSGDDNNNPSDSSASPLSQVVTAPAPCSQINAVVSMASNPDGTFTLTFVGTPQAKYYLLASPDSAAPMGLWTPVAGSTNTVTNSSGLWQVILSNSAPQQFYRSTAVTPCP